MSKKVKGIKKLNKAISAPLKKFGIKAELDTEFNFEYATNRLGYTLLTGDMGDECFRDFVKDRFNFIITDANEFVISILHEIGHSENNDEIYGNIQDFCASEKARISELFRKTNKLEEVRDLQYQYFNLPDEIMATAWAIDFAQKHPKKVRKMQVKMMNAIQDFYKKNITE